MNLEQHSAWAREQLDGAGYTEENSLESAAIRATVLELLTTLYDANKDMRDVQDILLVFNKLAQGHALPSSAAHKERWVPLRLGQIQLNDPVRVRADAFVGGQGLAHNGRRGRVVSIRRGDIKVRYDDGRTPAGPEMGISFDPAYLEKRVN